MPQPANPSTLFAWHNSLQISYLHSRTAFTEYILKSGRKTCEHRGSCFAHSRSRDLFSPQDRHSRALARHRLCQPAHLPPLVHLPIHRPRPLPIPGICVHVLRPVRRLVQESGPSSAASPSARATPSASSPPDGARARITTRPVSVFTLPAHARSAPFSRGGSRWLGEQL